MIKGGMFRHTTFYYIIRLIHVIEKGEKDLEYKNRYEGKQAGDNPNKDGDYSV